MPCFVLLWEIFIQVPSGASASAGLASQTELERSLSIDMTQHLTESRTQIEKRIFSCGDATLWPTKLGISSDYDIAYTTNASWTVSTALRSSETEALDFYVLYVSVSYSRTWNLMQQSVLYVWRRYARLLGSKRRQMCTESSSRMQQSRVLLLSQKLMQALSLQKQPLEQPHEQL